MNLELNFEQLQQKLKKVLNPSRFRFVVILYPNTNMIDDIKSYIKDIYPQSLVTNLDLKDKSYQDISSELYKNNEGFVYIDDFAQILDNSDLYYGFNQRRDKIASYNINLICFISLYEKEKLFTKALEVIPDLWEFKNTVLELEKDEESDILAGIKTIDSGSYSSIGGLTTKDKKIELKKLLKKLDSVSSDELKQNILYQIGTIYKDIGNYTNALEYYLKELKIKELLKVSDFEIAVSYNNISENYRRLGDLKKALKYQNNSIKIRESILDDKDLGLAVSYNNISVIYQSMNELQKAMEYQNKALKIRKNNLNDEHPDLAQSYNNISFIYRDMGKLKKALEYQKMAQIIHENILKDDHPVLALNYNNISELYRSMGEFKKALEYQNKAIKIIESILGYNHPDLAQSYNNLSLIYLGINNIKDARFYINKAIEIMKYNFPNGHPNLDNALQTQKYIYSK